MGDGSSRAQLILVGAVSFAVVLLAITVVFNSMIYTASVSPQATSISTSDADRLRGTVERDLEGLTGRVGGNDSLTPAEIDDLDGETRRYERWLGATVAEDGPAYVGVALNRSRTNSTTAAFDFTYDTASISYDTVVLVPVASLDDGGGADGPVLFGTNFTDGTYGEWTLRDDTEVEDGANSREPPAAVHSGDSVGTVEREYDTTGLTGLTIEYWAAEGVPGNNGPEPGEGENLTVAYRNSSGDWVTIHRLDAVQGSRNTYSASVNVSAATHPDAFHDGFALRFRLPGDNGHSDHWFLDDIVVRGRGP